MEYRACLIIIYFILFIYRYIYIFFFGGGGVSRASTNHLLLCELMYLCDVLPYNLTLSQLQKSTRDLNKNKQCRIIQLQLILYATIPLLNAKKIIVRPRSFLH